MIYFRSIEKISEKNREIYRLLLFLYDITADCLETEVKMKFLMESMCRYQVKLGSSNREFWYRNFFFFVLNHSLNDHNYSVTL